MNMDPKVLTRLMSDVKNDKWYSNPFKYILQKWETRGKLLVEAAAETYNVQFPKMYIESASIAYDIWIDIVSSTVSKRHGEVILHPNDFFIILESVEIMITVGLEERSIKHAYYEEAFRLKECNIIGQSAFDRVISIMHMYALELEGDHKQSRESLEETQSMEV